MKILIRAEGKKLTIDIPYLGEENCKVYMNDEFYNRLGKTDAVIFGEITDEKCLAKINKEYDINIY